MPLVINGGRVPNHWAQLDSHIDLSPARNGTRPAPDVNIALINNMPDGALEDTEAQFFSLLHAAAGDIFVHVQLYNLPDVLRGDRLQEHLRNFYLPVEELRSRRIDGAIITGTEPRERNLRDELYWDRLAGVFDWAEESTASTVLSCLAAHASVLHSDGIERSPLGDKQFGVFEYQRTCDHVLTDGLPQIVRFPQSRWNEIKVSALTAHGYDALDQSADAGINLFVKNKGNSLFVYFQGHPEYGSRTLLKEYRRDIRRFLKLERATYPSLPQGYFDAAGCELLSDFRKAAEPHPREEILADFPEAGLVDSLQNTWQTSAAHIYRNWLQYLLSKKATTSPVAYLAPAVRV
jgi:homoserine O-succinyltransferase/O-acetyltransferase